MRPAESFIAQPVRSLQTMLRVIAQEDGRQPSLIPDGIYGNQTMQAVTAFQRNNGLPATGVTDQTTWEAIVSVYEPAAVRLGPAQPLEIILEINLRISMSCRRCCKCYLMPTSVLHHLHTPAFWMMPPSSRFKPFRS